MKHYRNIEYNTMNLKTIDARFGEDFLCRTKYFLLLLNMYFLKLHEIEQLMTFSINFLDMIEIERCLVV